MHLHCVSEYSLVISLNSPYTSATLQLKSLRPAKYEEWSEQRMELAMLAVLEKSVSIRTAAEISSTKEHPWQSNFRASPPQ